jgi:pimeloyl-ACP methyl ester carboxylesterase
MSEQFCKVGDVELCYETFGDPDDPAILLIMGLGTQMIAWFDDFCRELVDRGFFVIRYDNRDTGRSTHLDHIRPPSTLQLALRRPKNVGYRLSDMADDAAGLLDHLGIPAAHVVGASMGGMIGQLLAARHPDRVLSLVSIMSSTGSRWSGQPAARVLPYLFGRTEGGKDAYVKRITKIFRAIGSRGFERGDDEIREIAERSYDRGVSEAAFGRQLAAIIATGSRVEDLKRIKAPTLVIHGTRDPLIKPSGGRATARAIPGAKLMMIKGMGHDLPRGAWPQIIDAIAANAARASEPSPAAA